MKLTSIAVVSLMIWELVGCATPIPSTIPTLPPEVTFSTTEAFQCWTAPASAGVGVRDSQAGMLLVTTGNIVSGLNLYRFDFSTNAYVQLITNIGDYGRQIDSPVSPDGRYIWYATVDKSRSSNLIFIYDLLNNRTLPIPYWSRLVIPENAIDWSSDGDCLFMWQRGRATAYHLADGAMQQKAFPTFEAVFDVRQSPDGRWWARAACQAAICIQDINGSVLTGAGLQISDPKSGSGLIRWSPTGTVLAFGYSTNSRDHSARNIVRLIYFREGQITTYEDIPHASGHGVDLDNMWWSPDGRQLLMANGAEETMEIYNVETKQLIRLPHSYSSSVPPVWSPDGKKIAFVSNQHKNLYTMNADGTNISALPSPSNELIWNIFWTS